MNAFVSLSVVAITLFIAYSGMMFMINPTNEEHRIKARNGLLNAVIGLLIILCAWTFIDSVMKVLYKSDSQFGPWNSILGTQTGPDCLVAHEAGLLPTFSLTDSEVKNANAGGGYKSPVGPAVTPASVPQTGTGACSPSKVLSSAKSGGYNISQSEANVLACIAKPESSCGAYSSGATTPSGKSTSAAGPWQILLGSSDKCHSLNIPACGNLNCSAAYRGGKVKPDAASQQLAALCQAKANDLACSAAAAACLVAEDKGYSAWTADPRSSKQKQCIAIYGGG